MKKTFVITIWLLIGLLGLLPGAAAADSLPGWTDLMKDYGVSVPREAENAMNPSVPMSFQAGPLTLNVRQLLCDGHMAMLTGDVTVTEGGEALFLNYYWDAEEPMAINESGERLAGVMGLPEGVSWAQAAALTRLPVYQVEAWLEVAPDLDAGERMEDMMWAVDGRGVCFCQTYLKSWAVGEMLSAEICLYASAWDPETGERTSSYEGRFAVELPVLPAAEERVYRPDTPLTVDGISLNTVLARRCLTGMYLEARFTADEEIRAVYLDRDARLQAMGSLFQAQWMSLDGEMYPMGMYLLTAPDAEEWPCVTLLNCLSVEQLPDALMLRLGEAEATLH